MWDYQELMKWKKTATDEQAEAVLMLLIMRIGAFQKASVAWREMGLEALGKDIDGLADVTTAAARVLAAERGWDVVEADCGMALVK